MSQEIIYTSAPKGLKPGSRGFCTVISTAGMAKNLADRLETLSGYQHQYMPHEEGENPVNYVHVRLTVGGKRYHVLSRICDAGLDYTKRTNKLAHHIALSTSEASLAPGGPAWVAAQDGFLVTEWNGDVKTVPESQRKLTSKPCPEGICNAWKALGVDPGWAGVLAETAEKKSQPMTVIFATGTDTLALTRDAMSLVKPEKRWDVTFSTYFTKLPAGVDCLWRFVLDGTQEAKTLRRNPHARVIDLCDPSLGNAPDSRFAQMARLGVVTPNSPESSSVAKPAAKQVAIVKAPPALTPLAPVVDGHTPGLELIEDEPRAASTVVIDPQFANHRGLLIRRIAAIVATTLLMALVVTVAYYAGRPPGLTAPTITANTRQATAQSNSNHQPRISEETVSDAGPNPADLLSPEARQQIEAAELRNEEQRQREAEEDAHRRRIEAAEKRQQNRPEDDAASATPQLPRHVHKPFDDIKARGNKLSLPEKPYLSGGIPLTATGPRFVEVAKLYVSNLEHCKLQLRVNDIRAESDPEVKIERIDEDGIVSWRIVPQIQSFGLGDRPDAGTFQLNNGSLLFRWGNNRQLDLTLCRLDITVEGRTEICDLAVPKRVDPVQLRFDAEEVVIHEHFHYERKDVLRVMVWFAGDGFERFNTAPSRGLKLGDKAFLRIESEDLPGEKKFIEVDVTFNDRGLVLKPYVYPRMIDPDDPAKLVSRLGQELRPHDIKTTQVDGKPLTYDQLARWKTIANTTLDKISKAETRRKNIEESFKSKREITKKKMIANRVAQIDPAIPRAERDRKVKEEARNVENELVEKFGFRQEEGRRLAEYKSLVEENGRWAEEMESFMDRINNRGKIHFRVYANLSGRELDLVTTEPTQ